MPEAEPVQFKYRAFLSYRSSDAKLAEKVHRALERYRVPRSLVGRTGTRGRIPARLGRVFRDRDELRSAQDTETIISQEISHSESLIVLCTPAAAASESWVGREIELFRQRRPDGEIHALIGSGHPPECFPKQLLRTSPERTVEQPLAADLRKDGDGHHRALTKIVAGLIGVPFDDLWRRERRRIIRHRIAAVVLLSVLGLVAMMILGAMKDLERSTGLLRLADDPLTEESFRPHLALAALRSDESIIDFRPAYHPAVSSFVALNKATRVFGDHSRTHSSMVRTAVPSPDGRYVVSASDQDDLRVFRADDLSLLSVGPREHPWAEDPFIVHSPVGNQFASFNARGKRTIRLWNGNTGKPTHTLEGLAERVLHAAFSADGSLLAASSRESSVLVWDTATGNLRKPLPVGQRWIRHLAFSPRKEEHLIAASSRDGVHLWNALTGEELQVLKGNAVERIVWSGFSPDGRYLVALDEVGGVTTWDVRRHVAHTRFRLYAAKAKGSIGAMEMHGSRNQALSPCFVDSACLWDYVTGRPIERWKIANSPHKVTGTRLSADGETILAFSSDGFAHLWSVTSGSRPKAVKVQDIPGEFDGAFVNGATKFVTFGTSREFRVWDFGGKELSAPIDKEVDRIAVTKDGTVMATWSSAGKGIDVWSLREARLTHRIRCSGGAVAGSQDYVTKAHVEQLCSNERQFEKHSLHEIAEAEARADGAFTDRPSVIARSVSVGTSDRVELVDLKTGRSVRLAGLTSAPRAMAVNSQGNLVSTVSRDLVAKVWDTNSGQLLTQVPGHRLTMYDIDFDHTGTKFVATSTTSVQIFNVLARKVEKVIRPGGHEARFSESGKYIAVASTDGSARVYDVRTGIELVRLLGGTSTKTDSVAWGRNDESVLLTSGPSVLEFSLGNVNLQGARKSEACRLAVQGSGAFSLSELQVPKPIRGWEPPEVDNWRPLQGAELCPCEQKAAFTRDWWLLLVSRLRIAGESSSFCPG